MSGGGPDALFAYGTLQVEAVVRAVLGRRPEAREAELPDHARTRVADAPYPGLFEAPGATTPGLLYAGIEEAEWALLDAFEGPLYERRAVRVHTAAGLVAARAYVVPERHRERLTEEPWELERFRARDLPHLLAGEGWADRGHAGQSATRRGAGDRQGPAAPHRRRSACPARPERAEGLSPHGLTSEGPTP